ncbi:MAG: DNA-binding protein [Tepidisphaeraceae bacterium]
MYIETTIAGHLTSRLPRDMLVAGQMLATRDWWDQSRHLFDLYTSEVVIDEASQGDPQAAAERLAVLASLPLVPVIDAAAEIAELLLARSALPAKARVDAVHVAVAATNGIEYLLTWKSSRCAENAVLSRRSFARRWN